MDEDREALKYVAQQYSIIDHLTRKVYGPGVRFEQLSAFGQNQIEALARDSGLLEPQREPKQAESQINTLRRNLVELEEKLVLALRENQDLWEENEQLKQELYKEE